MKFHDSCIPCDRFLNELHRQAVVVGWFGRKLKESVMNSLVPHTQRNRRKDFCEHPANDDIHSQHSLMHFLITQCERNTTNFNRNLTEIS